ncbi:RCC1 domain-containing protein [bacterium]|nr:RCC1 domain-containing protein [bacterium]
MKFFTALLLILFVTACSHPLEIVGEGDIISASGSRDCSLQDFRTEAESCTKNLVLDDYNETYSAIPKEGWAFVGWQGCGEQHPDCLFNVSAATVTAFWFQTMPPLVATFEEVPKGVGPTPEYKLTSLSTGTGHTCVLEEGVPVCWGNNDYGQLNAPALTNPIEICAGGQHTCAMDAEGVKCWGAGSIVDSENDFKQAGQSIVPKLSNPRSLSCGLWTTCAIDDEGAKCWGLHGENTTPMQTQPTKVSAGINAACSITANAAQCEVAEFEPVRDMTNEPVLIAPIVIDVGKYNACAIDRDGVVCWGTSEALKNVPPLNNPSQLEVGEGFACALDDNGVTCWGGEEYVSAGPGPIMQNPRSISVGDYNACAFDGEAVVCWYDPGAFGEGDVPERFRRD